MERYLRPRGDPGTLDAVTSERLLATLSQQSAHFVLALNVIMYGHEVRIGPGVFFAEARALLSTEADAWHYFRSVVVRQHAFELEARSLSS